MTQNSEIADYRDIDPRQLWCAIERRGLGGTPALALGLNHASDGRRPTAGPLTRTIAQFW